MMVGKHYMEHLAYMIDFGICSIATAVPWISMVFDTPFRVLKIQQDDRDHVVQPIARHATQDRAGRYL